MGGSGVTSGDRGRTARVTPFRMVTPEGKNFVWANVQRIVEIRGRAGKKGVG